MLYRTLNGNTFVIGLDLGYNNIGDAGGEILGKLLQVRRILIIIITTCEYLKWINT